VQPPVTLFPGEETPVLINQTLSGLKKITVGKIVLYSYSLYISDFKFFQKHGVGLITFVTENAQRNTVGPLRVHSLAPVWCLDSIISTDDTLCYDACRWQDVLSRLLIWLHERNITLKLHVQIFLRMNTWVFETCRRHYNVKSSYTNRCTLY